MNQRRLFAMSLALLVSTAFIYSCNSTPKKKMDAKGKSDWQKNMLMLSNDLSTLLPLVISRKEFEDPSNYKIIEQKTASLADIAHEVKSTKVKPDGDPGLEFVSRKFAEDMLEAKKQLYVGNRQHARYIIRNTTTFCIACHTRNDSGRQNLGISIAPSNFLKFTPLEKAQYHIAVREFDKALDDFDKAVNTPEAFTDTQSLETTAERVIAVAVRVKRDPNLASEFVSRVIDSKWAPIYMRLSAREWKKSIQDWVTYDKQMKGSAKLPKPEKLLADAKELMAKGWKHTASSPQSRAGLVDYLRASTLLHDLLGQGNMTPNYGEALYYAGLAAEALRDINLWTLHEAYYEACIRHQPYTRLAKKCYLRLEALQLSAYSGTGGNYLPGDIRDHLLELKALAEKGEGDFLEWGFVE